MNKELKNVLTGENLPVSPSPYVQSRDCIRVTLKSKALPCDDGDIDVPYTRDWDDVGVFTVQQIVTLDRSEPPPVEPDTGRRVCTGFIWAVHESHAGIDWDGVDPYTAVQYFEHQNEAIRALTWVVATLVGQKHDDECHVSMETKFMRYTQNVLLDIAFANTMGFTEGEKILRREEEV